MTALVDRNNGPTTIIACNSGRRRPEEKGPTEKEGPGGVCAEVWRRSFGGREDGDEKEKMILVTSDTSRDAPLFGFTKTGVYREGKILDFSSCSSSGQRQRVWR